MSADDDEQGARALRVRVEQVRDGNDVGADEGEEVGRQGPGVGEPVVVLGMGAALAVDDDGDDADDDGDEEREETRLGLVDAAAATGEPLDQPVAAVAVRGQGDEGGDDLAGVGVAGRGVRPVVGGRLDDASVLRKRGSASVCSWAVCLRLIPSCRWRCCRQE